MAEAEKLYVVAWGWDDKKPTVLATDATHHNSSWVLSLPKDGSIQSGRVRTAFQYRKRVVDSERVSMLIGLDPVDAVHLALEDRQRKAADLENRLRVVSDELAELSFLGLAEAKVVL